MPPPRLLRIRKQAFPTQMKEYSTEDPADQAEHDRLMQMAQESDIENEGGPVIEDSASATQAEAGDEKKTETRVDGQAGQSEDKQSDSPEKQAEQKPEAPAGERPRGPDGKFIPKEKVEQEPEKQEVKESEYARLRKEQERLAKSWQQVDAEKAEARADKQRLAALEQQVRDVMQRQPRTSVDAGPRFGSQQYRLAAQGFTQQGNKLMEEGDLDGMREQFKLAGEAARAAQEAYQEELQVAGNQFGERWQQYAVSIIQQHPELEDPATPESQAVGNILERAPLLRHIADGFEWARQFAYGQLASARLSGLEDKVKQLETENASLKKLTSPLGGRTTTAHARNTPFDNMNDKEQHDYLLRKAELADE